MRVQLIKHLLVRNCILATKENFNSSSMLADNVVIADSSDACPCTNPVILGGRNIGMKFCLPFRYLQQSLPKPPTKIGTLISLLSSFMFFVSNPDDVVRSFWKWNYLLDIYQHPTVVLIRNNTNTANV